MSTPVKNLPPTEPSPASLPMTSGKVPLSEVPSSPTVTDFAAFYNDAALAETLAVHGARMGEQLVVQALTLHYLAQDTTVPEGVKQPVRAALGFFVSPFDIIPDHLPNGFADDAAVIASVYTTFEEHISEAHRAAAIVAANKAVPAEQKQPRVLEGLMPCHFLHADEFALLKKLNESYEKLGDISARAEKEFAESIERHRRSCKLVTEQTFPRVHKLYIETCRRLCIKNPPPVYFEYDNTRNAAVSSADPNNASMFLNFGIVNAMSDAEMHFVLGHELGHFLSEHGKYSNFANGIRDAATVLIEDIFRHWKEEVPFAVGLLDIVVNQAFNFSRNKWSQLSEFGCDRAGLLACQNLNAALSALLKLERIPSTKLAGKDTTQLLKLAAENFDSTHKNMQDSFSEIGDYIHTHPNIRDRLNALKKWVDNGWYNAIVFATKEDREKLAADISSETIRTDKPFAK